MLCKAALETPWHIPCGGVVYGDASLVFIANDWHAALLPVYLKVRQILSAKTTRRRRCFQAHYQEHGKLLYARSLFVLHNIAFQGRGPLSELPLFEIPDHYSNAFRLCDANGGEHMNLMKAALIHSHRIVAVSHGYAWECQTEEGGWGLDAVLRDQSWKLRGIVNGIDNEIWNPDTDPYLQQDGYVNYSLTSLDRKAICKAALQRELDLPIEPKVPLFGFIGRLDYQKGVDLIRDNFDWLMSEGAQLVLLGTGREDLEEDLREMERRRPEQCRSWVGFSVPTAHRITAGCDLLLMPSRFEPCGLTQLYALAYGTVPIVHAVGGLRDTVEPFMPYEESGTGWTFEWAEVESLRVAIRHALQTYHQFPESFRLLRERGMVQELGWSRVAERYNEVLIEAKYQW